MAGLRGSFIRAAIMLATVGLVCSLAASTTASNDGPITPAQVEALFKSGPLRILPNLDVLPHGVLQDFTFLQHRGSGMPLLAGLIVFATRAEAERFADQCVATGTTNLFGYKGGCYTKLVVVRNAVLDYDFYDTRVSPADATVLLRAMKRLGTPSFPSTAKPDPCSLLTNSQAALLIGKVHDRHRTDKQNLGPACTWRGAANRVYTALTPQVTIVLYRVSRTAFVSHPPTRGSRSVPVRLTEKLGAPGYELLGTADFEVWHDGIELNFEINGPSRTPEVLREVVQDAISHV